jgi:hypothetical protein
MHGAPARGQDIYFQKGQDVIMNPVLVKIKRLIISGNYIFTRKAELEMFRDGITAECVLESILNANGITKTIRPTSPVAGKHEKLYIIESFTYDGLLIYTKGAIKKDADGEHFYLLISSKKSFGN